MGTAGDGPTVFGFLPSGGTKDEVRGENIRLGRMEETKREEANHREK